MEIKEIEGVEYILKSEVDDLVRSRLSKVSERARAAESRAAELEKTVEANKGASAKLSDLQLQIESLQQELEQSKELYTVHSTIAKHGFTDPELRDLVEWQYKRAQKGKGKKEQVDLDTWLSNMHTDPQQAPVSLRPFIGKSPDAATLESKEGAEQAAAEQPAASAAERVQIESMDRAQLVALARAAAAQQQPPVQPAAQQQSRPYTQQEMLAMLQNAPVQEQQKYVAPAAVVPNPPVEAGNIIDRALADPTGKIWKENNAEIQRYYYDQRVPSPFKGR